MGLSKEAEEDTLDQMSAIVEMERSSPASNLR